MGLKYCQFKLKIKHRKWNNNSYDHLNSKAFKIGQYFETKDLKLCNSQLKVLGIKTFLFETL